MTLPIPATVQVAQSVNDRTTTVGAQSYLTLTICAKSVTNKRLACPTVLIPPILGTRADQRDAYRVF